MSRFPTMTAPGVLPEARVSSANLGQAPEFQGLGLDRALAGISSGLIDAANAMAQTQRMERQLADEQDRRDRLAKQAQVETSVADFQTQSVVGVGDDFAASMSLPVADRVKDFDERVRSRNEAIDTLTEDPEVRAKTRLWLTQLSTRQRDRLVDQNARDTADTALASLVELRATLGDQVGKGMASPAEAQAVYADRVASLAGTALSREQAAKMAEEGASQFYAKQADALYAQAEQDPQANRALYEFIASPEAKRYLDSSALSEMGSKLDGMLIKAEKSHASRTLAAAQRAVSEVLPRGQAPDTWWASNSPKVMEGEMNQIVSHVMEQPGTRMSGGLVDGRPATEGDVREKLFVPALKASAAVGDRQGFEMFARLLRPVGNIEANASPEVEQIIADQMRLMDERQVRVNLIDEAKQSIDATFSRGASGVGNPAFRNQRAMDQWAEQKLATDPAVTLGDIARFTIHSGAPLPTVVRSAIDDGFGEGATTQQTFDAINTLKAVQGVDPLAADRLAQAAKQSDAARTLLNLPPGIVPIEQAAQTVLSAGGRSGVKSARAILEGGVDGFDINAVTQANRAGISADYSTLPPNARNAFDAAFSFRMAQASERMGADVFTGDKQAVIADEAARQAMEDVMKTQAVVEVLDLMPTWRDAYLVDRNGAMMVDPRLYGLAPGSRNDSDSAFGSFLEQGRASFDEFRVPGLAFLGDLNIGNSQDVRPDLGFVGEWDAFDSLGQSVVVPILDRTTQQPTGFLLWDPINQRDLGSVSPTDTDRFTEIRTRFMQSSTAEIRDPDRAYRRPIGSQTAYMSSASALLAERFEQRVRQQAYAMGRVGSDLPEYLDARARELGWEGYASPAPVEAQP